MGTNYERGRAFEYRARDRMLGWGAVTVIRAAGSKGAADLVAFWPHGRPWLVQAKLDGKLPKPEVDALMDLLRKIDVRIVLAKPGPNGRGVMFIDLGTQEELDEDAVHRNGSWPEERARRGPPCT